MPHSSLPLSVLLPEITDDSVRWRIPRAWAPDGVRLEMLDWILQQDPRFGADGDWWTYQLARPTADRLEYRLDLQGGGGTEHRSDQPPHCAQSVRRPIRDPIPRLRRAGLAGD